MSSGLPPSSLQEGALNASLNGALVEVLLLGVYTVVYIETLYIYLTKKESKQWTIITTISILYLVYVLEMGVEWDFNKKAFIDQGTSRESVFIATVVVPSWSTLVTDICGALQAGLADGLLIWRCFNVWDGSLRAILVPSFLLLSEAAIYLTVIIMASAEKLEPSESQAHTLNNLTAAALFMTFVTSFLTTTLISYRIYLFTKQDIRQGTRARFRHLLEIVIQSAAAYAMITIASAIVALFSLNNANFVSLIAAQIYTSTFYAFIAGFAPTVMVARVAFANDKNKDHSNIGTPVLSGIQFGSRPNNGNETHSGEHSISDNGVADREILQELEKP